MIHELARQVFEPGSPLPKYSDTAFLVEIGVASQFDQNAREGEVCYSELVALPGIATTRERFLLATLSTDTVQWANLETFLHSVLLFAEKDGEIDPIGHVDFNQYCHELRIADAGYAHLGRGDLVGEAIANLPAHLRKASEAYQDFTRADGRRIHQSALKINEEYRGRGLGSLLWGIGCSYMELHGASVIRLHNDITDGFYKKLGAQTRTKEWPVKPSLKNSPIRTINPQPRVEILQWMLARPLACEQVAIAQAFGL